MVRRGGSTRTICDGSFFFFVFFPRRVEVGYPYELKSVLYIHPIYLNHFEFYVAYITREAL